VKFIKIAPSILSADFSRLGEEIAKAERGGADLIHIDVMDGCFVPQITIGALVVKSIRPLTHLPLDVHLMVKNPENQIEQFLTAGADVISFHIEALSEPSEAIQRIKGEGKKAGIALNPATPISSLDRFLSQLDLILLMTVNPGFAGQAFMDSVLPKIASLREALDERGLKTDIEVDGGINLATAKLAVQAGATILVAGQAIFGSAEGPQMATRNLSLHLETLLKRGKLPP
jgi:ribulose-phosphate 3-epimerase